jgi:hypothetical protein
MCYIFNLEKRRRSRRDFSGTRNLLIVRNTSTNAAVALLSWLTLLI